MPTSPTDKQQAGIAAYEAGDYETAIGAFREARRVWNELGDTYAEADALMSEGVAHTRVGNYEDARSAYKEALELFTEIGACEGQATVLGNLGTLFYMRGSSDQATEHLERAADLFLELKKPAREADTLRLLARVYLRRLDWLNALLVYDRALSRMESLTGQQKFLRTLITIFLKLIGVQVD